MQSLFTSAHLPGSLRKVAEPALMNFVFLLSCREGREEADRVGKWRDQYP